MKLHFKQYFFFLLLTALANTFFAQRNVKIKFGDTENDKKFEEAQMLFNSSSYFESEKLLNEIIQTKFVLNKYHKQDVYELLIKNQLETDNVMGADSTAFQMLRRNPNYELKEENNTEDFNRLIKKFDVHPLFTLGIRSMSVTPYFKTTKTYSVLTDVDYSIPFDKIAGFINYNVWFEFLPITNLSINGEIGSFYLAPHRVLSKNGWTLKYNERMVFLEMPLFIKKYINLGSKNIFAYGTLGMGYLGLASSSATIELKYDKTNIYTGQTSDTTISADGIDMIKMRNISTWEWEAGGGAGIRFKRFALSVDMRYTGGIGSFNNSKTRFNNSSLINDYKYIDNAVRLSKFEFGGVISYTFNTKIRKKK